MIPYMVGKLAPNPTHSTRGLVKYVPGRGNFRAFPSQNGDKSVTSPPPSIVERVYSTARIMLFVYFQVNNGVVYLDYEDSHHHGPLLCSFQLLYRICLYCLMMYWFVFPFVGVPAWRLM